MDEETPDTHVDFVAEAVSYLAHSQPMVSDDYIIMTSGDYCTITYVIVMLIGIQMATR